MRRIFIKNCNKEINNFVIIYGWVESIRNMGKIIFFDLRDREKQIQIVVNKKIKIKKNYCVRVYGKVVSHKNNIEVLCYKLKIINKSIYFDYRNKNPERIVYLKNKKSKSILFYKNVVFFNIRKYLNFLNFIEIETPLLTSKTKEGAKLFKVENKYYLSQSPQIYKQILMISEYDRYFQFAKCFRNEDIKSNRQPEFTQLDIEMSFSKDKDIENISYEILRIFMYYRGIFFYKSFKIKYKTCINKWGTENPDLRINIYFKKISKKIFYIKIDKKINIKLNIKKVIFISSKRKLYGLPYNKLINYINKKIIRKYFYIIIFKNKIYPKVLEYTLKKISFSLEGKQFINNFVNLVWVYDIPMFKRKYKCFHHPFTYFNSIKKKIPYIKKFFRTIKSKSYDLILNGNEIAGGSNRINSYYKQKKLFKILNIEKYFKQFLKCLKYGTPNHLGIAFGLDRIVQSLMCLNSIRDCIAFPKNS
ncbi:amino acid--tRNA ligase-related protein [Candidatus Vidania fulgoroideorum]